ncbi:MAG TPA: alpha/beta hydrolase [Dehalococcoidia bacterium]|nr:alpha/beta hydrolase [Dehalococcoidia bacterium]
MQVSVRSTGTVSANGAELYYERRGSGPAVLFISGATGDAGHFAQVADLLADEFTVITYDRRGNSRSPRPAGWTTTSMDEQADDAAGLLRALGLAPAAALGTSGGALVLLSLLQRHPEVVRGALVHEPPLVSMLPNAAEIGAELQTQLQQALAEGGPRGAMAAFIRAEAGVASFEQLDPALRERMLTNGELFFSLELPAFVSYVPDAPALLQATVPFKVLAGRESRGVYTHESARWLAGRLGTDLTEVPGAHAPYFDQPYALAEALRPLLAQLG